MGCTADSVIPYNLIGDNAYGNGFSILAEGLEVVVSRTSLQMAIHTRRAGKRLFWTVAVDLNLKWWLKRLVLLFEPSTHTVNSIVHMVLTQMWAGWRIGDIYFESFRGCAPYF